MTAEPSRDLTPWPIDDAALALPNAGLGDARVRLTVPAQFFALGEGTEWRSVPNTDFEVRRTNGGLGCRCGAEIRAALSHEPTSEPSLPGNPSQAT